jgi:hypothetical protein
MGRGSWVEPFPLGSPKMAMAMRPGGGGQRAASSLLRQWAPQWGAECGLCGAQQGGGSGSPDGAWAGCGALGASRDAGRDLADRDDADHREASSSAGLGGPVGARGWRGGQGIGPSRQAAAWQQASASAPLAWGGGHGSFGGARLLSTSAAPAAGWAFWRKKDAPAGGDPQAPPIELDLNERGPPTPTASAAAPPGPTAAATDTTAAAAASDPSSLTAAAEGFFPLAESSLEAMGAIGQACDAVERASLAAVKADAWFSASWFITGIEYVHEEYGLPWWVEALRPGARVQG